MTDDLKENSNIILENLPDIILESNDLEEETKNNIKILRHETLHSELLEELLKPLISSIERMQAEATHATNSFGKTTKEVITALLSAKQSIHEVIERLDNPLTTLSENSELLRSTAMALSILPDKIDEITAKLPQNFNDVITHSIPGITKQLNSAIAQPIEQMVQGVNELQKSIAVEIKESMNKSVKSFQIETRELSQQFKHDILSHKSELEEIIEASIKNRMRRLFITLTLAGSFAGIVAGLSSWFINSRFPRSVEINGNQHLVVKDSQVLVNGSGTYKFDKQQNEVK